MKTQELVLKRDLARRDDLPGDFAALQNLDELPRETVVLIHGTFANRAASWWLPGSDFCRKLDSSLLQRNSRARCWAHIDSDKDVFAWTGDNLESERCIAGDRLAKEIADLETSADTHRYHIVAHSHGGNVVLRALRSLAEDPKKLGAVIFLGTPVLCFSRLPTWLNRSALAMLLYVVGAALSSAVAVHRGESLRSVLASKGSFLYAWSFTDQAYPWFILMAIGFGLLLLYEWGTRSRCLSSIYGSGHSHAFEFAADEAMRALQLSLAIAQRPGDALKQLFSTKAPPKYAVDPPRPQFWKVIWSDFKQTALYRLLKDSEFPTSFRPTSFWQATRGKSLVQKFVFVLLIIVAASMILSIVLTFPDSYINIRYFQKERPYLADLISRVQSLSETVFNTTGSLILGIAVLCVLTLFFWRFLSVVFKFGRLGLAWAAQLFLQGPGVRIMGLVVRNAAFGGQCKHVLWPHELPEKERAHSEAISDELNEKMIVLSTSTAVLAGEAIYSALTEGDALQLKEHILARLTDPKLAHCQYYCEDEVISRIAELIDIPLSNPHSGAAKEC